MTPPTTLGRWGGVDKQGVGERGAVNADTRSCFTPVSLARYAQDDDAPTADSYGTLSRITAGQDQHSMLHVDAPLQSHVKQRAQ